MQTQHINLIPSATRRRQAIRRMLRWWVQWTTALCLLAAVALALDWARGSAALRELSELEARYAPIERLARETKSMADKVAALQAREQLSLRLTHEAHGIVLLGAIAEAAGENPGTVYVQQLQFQANIVARAF